MKSVHIGSGGYARGKACNVIQSMRSDDQPLAYYLQDSIIRSRSQPCVFTEIAYIKLAHISATGNNYMLYTFDKNCSETVSAIEHANKADCGSIKTVVSKPHPQS